MSAQDNLSPQQFFRGHSEVHKPGDTIDPGSHGYVYATTHTGNARTYGKNVYQVEFTGSHSPDPEYSTARGPDPAFRRSREPVRVIRDASAEATGSRDFG